MKKRAFVSDFDGTISKKDFFYYVIDNHLGKDNIAPWNSYKAGEITHVEALRQIFKKIRMSQSELKDFILSMPIEECFIDTVHYCHDNDIPFYIMSAGADYYIDTVVATLNIADKVKIIANKSIYDENGGITILPSDPQNLYYSENFGISKKIAVNVLKQEYETVIFAGDGVPDVEPASVADVVFAKDYLLEKCRENNINAIPYKSYCEILRYLKNG